MTAYETIEQTPASRPDAAANFAQTFAPSDLSARPVRAPDYKAESEALASLARELVTAPTQVLQKLCELALELCGAHAAGIRLEEEETETGVLHWRALAGEMDSCLQAITPDDLASYGVTDDCRAPRLFSRPEAPVPYVQAISPLISEFLLIPFCPDDKPVGTLWVVGSWNDRRFDAEDARLLTNLSQFAGAAYKVLGIQADVQVINTRLAAEAALHKAVEEERRASEAEQALKASELKFRSLFENAREAIGIATKGRVVFVNPAYARLLGYASPDEMIGLSALETVAPKDQPRLIEMAHKRNAGEDAPFTYEYRGRKKDGTECDLENYVSSYEQNGQIYTVVTTRDITARKQDEIARQFLTEASAVLASSLDYEQTLQQVADLAVPHIADWCGVDIREEDGSISQLAVAHVNPEKVRWGHELRKRYPPNPNDPHGLPGVLRSGQAEIYSHIPDELLVASARDPEHLEMVRQIGLDSLMIVPIVARERILGAITFVATDESGHHYTEADLELAQGLASRAALAIDNARLYRAAQDELTERRRVQAALLASEERFRFALANSSIIVYTQDLDLRYTWVYYGALSGEDSNVYGKTDADLLPAEDALPLMEIKRRVLQTGIEERHTVRATLPGQEPLYLETSFAPLRDAAGNLIGITGTANDITERKKAQDILAQHQAEIEALNARLRRSMRETHHRVKNNLQVITALINMQQMQYEEQVPTSELQRLTQHIRALASIHDLLTHQAQTNAEVTDISVEDVMDKLMPAVQSMAVGRSITFAIEDMRLPVRQSTTFAVLVNEMVSNALKHGAGAIHVGFRVEGDAALLEVLDEGPGFPPGFNPERAANTGLDLIGSLSRMDMRGSARYENRAEGGARVVVEFPVPSLLKTPGEQYGESS